MIRLLVFKLCFSGDDDKINNKNVIVDVAVGAVVDIDDIDGNNYGLGHVVHDGPQGVE